MVAVEGAVLNPGHVQLPSTARLSDAVLVARPATSAYPLGAALLRSGALPAQARLKAGLLYDLKVLAGNPDPATATTSAALADWLQTLPVTGRLPQLLEPRLLSIRADADRVVANGDRIRYPTRPDYVRIVGAVQAPCQLPHHPTQDLRHYLPQCITTAAADRDVVYAIQPDGVVQRLGIALWNRGPEQPLAPGATLYVPLAANAVATLDGDFNREFAEFLATQPLPIGEVRP